MSVTEELIQLASERIPHRTDKELADALDVSKQALSNWQRGIREIERADLIAQVCLVIGEDPAVWFAKFAGERSASANVKKWAKRAANAAALFLGVLTAGLFFALPQNASASEVHAPSENAQGVYIMRYSVGMERQPRLAPCVRCLTSTSYTRKCQHSPVFSANNPPQFLRGVDKSPHLSASRQQVAPYSAVLHEHCSSLLEF